MSEHDPHDAPTRVDTPVGDHTQVMPAATGNVPPGPPPGTGEPPSEPPNRGPWIIGGVLLLIAAAVVALWLVNRDDDDDSAATSTTSTTVEETTTTSSTTTTEPTTTTSTTTTTQPGVTVAPGLCKSSAPDDPDTTAQIVYQAYTLGDRDCAEKLADDDAVDDLFSIPGNGQGWEFAGCFDEDEPNPHTLCSFTFEGGATDFRMNYSATQGWKVFEVFQVAD